MKLEFKKKINEKNVCEIWETCIIGKLVIHVSLES